MHTDLVGESCEDRASGAASDPEHERVVGGASLGADEVVEEADAISIIHLHVPAGRTQERLMLCRTRSNERNE